MKLFAFLLIFATFSGSALAASDTAPAPAAKTPVLLELFTSEGCSSCPPADAFVRKLDATQPLSNAQIIVLSEHVDYWDHDGWKDPYSSHLFTFRQEEYTRAFHLDSPYTPQIILDGTQVVDLGKPQLLDQTFQKAAEATTVPVLISSLSVDQSSPAVLRAHIEVDGTHAPHNGDVYVAVALNHAESQVLRGENKGRDLEHVAVVESLTKIGSLQKGKTFSKDFEAKLKAGLDPGNIRMIAFVQESGPGEVLGAAMEKVAKEAVGQANLAVRTVN